MKDKRTYTNKKEHGEDMTHENETKIKPSTDSLTITTLTDQYKAELFKYKQREADHIKTKNQLDGTKQIVMEMAGTIKQIHTENENFQAEIARLREEIQLLELQIKK